MEVYTPKYLPEDKDWIVTYDRNRSFKYYYDSTYNDNEIRKVVAKLENVPFMHINICRYHKLNSFKTMHNFK